MNNNKSREMALITGASSGIGSEFARELAARGYDLIVTARRQDRLLALKKELEASVSCRVDVIAADLGSPGGPEALIREVEASGRSVSVLINNAGFGVHGDFLDNDAERVAQMVQLNISALTTLTWHFGRSMRSVGRGCILQVSSIAAFQPSPYYAAYAATKAYVLFLSEAVNRELSGSGVTVTTLCPGMTATEFHDVAKHPKTGLVALTTMSARAVARVGLDAALGGRAVVTAGLLNKLLGLSTRLVPRALATWLAGVLMRR